MNKKSFFAVVLSAVLFQVGPTGGIARASDGPWCSQSYRFTSYGRGVEAQFRSAASLRPELLDEGCYRIGISVAKAAIQESSASDCREDFNRGYEHGKRVDSLAGNECFSLGYESGVASLEWGAREKKPNVSASCIENFKTGYRAALEYEVPAVSSDAVDAHCYLTGYRDGELFR